MFKKIILSLDDSEKKLAVFKPVEKVKKNIKVIVKPSHKAVIFRDGVVKEVLDSGIYKPFGKEDKRSIITIAFINIEKSGNINFSTRISQVMEISTGKIYNIGATGSYTFSVRNERKFLATCDLMGMNFSDIDFAERIDKEINSVIFSYISDYFAKNKNSYSNYLKHSDKLIRYVLVMLDKYLDNTYGLEIRDLTFDNVIIENVMNTK